MGLFYKKAPLIGVVLEMPNMKLYTAIKDQGAWCEGEKIESSNTKNI